MMEWNDAALACCGVFLPREEDRKMLCSILNEETQARVRSLSSRGERISRDQVFLRLGCTTVYINQIADCFQCEKRNTHRQQCHL